MTTGFHKMGFDLQFYREVDLGNVKIDISVLGNGGFNVVFTAKDGDDNRLWRTALTDAEGNVRYTLQFQKLKRQRKTLLKAPLVKTACISA